MNKKFIKIITLLIMLTMIVIPVRAETSNKIKLGDINSDNIMDSVDVLLMLRHIASVTKNTHSEWKLTDDKFKLADLNEDEKVDLLDILYLQRYIVASANSKIKEKHPEWLELKEIEIEPTPEPEPEPTEIKPTEIKPTEIKVTGIKVNKSNITLNMNGSKTTVITATVIPTNATDKSVTFNSSNSNIASIDKNGKITAKKNGTVVITAKSKNGKEAKSTIKVITSATKLTLKPSTTNIYAVKTSNTANKVTIQAKFEPNTVTEKNITWTTSISNKNNKLVTVKKENDKITITANEIGHVTGTVTVKGKTSNGKTATCKINVKPIDATKWKQNEKIYTSYIQKYRTKVEKEQYNLLVKKDSKAKDFSWTIGSNQKWWKGKPAWRKNNKNNKSKLSYLINLTKKTNVNGTGFDSCSGWVHMVFRNAGIGYYTGRSASQLCEMWCLSSDKKELKPGMVIAVTTTGKRSNTTAAGRIYGHIGIYVGNGKVRHRSAWCGTIINNIPNVRETTLDKWIKTYGTLSKPRWGWFGGVELENDMTKTIK